MPSQGFDLERDVDGSAMRSKRDTRRAKPQSRKVDQMLDDSCPASDPPSWTGSNSGVRPLEPRHVNDSLIRRVRAEFMEMPGLALTLAQAQRLWSMDRRTCEVLLTSLTDSRFLHRTRRGLFVLRATRF